MRHNSEPLRRRLKPPSTLVGDYPKLIKKADLTQSISSKGECLDNAPMERFFASLKKELVQRQRFKARAQTKAAMLEYIEVFYTRSAAIPETAIKRRNRPFEVTVFRV